MSLGGMTRERVEARAADQSNTILQALFNLASLRQRMVAENAAGNLDGPEWYQGAAADKTNVLGALDQWFAIAAWFDDADHPDPGVAAGADPLAYVRFLIGNA